MFTNDWKCPEIDPPDAIENDPLLKWLLTEQDDYNTPPPYGVQLVEVCDKALENKESQAEYKKFTEADPFPEDWYMFSSDAALCNKKPLDNTFFIAQESKDPNFVFLWTLDRDAIDDEEWEGILRAYDDYISREEFVCRFNKIHPIMALLIAYRKKMPQCIESVKLFQKSHVKWYTMSNGKTFNLPFHRGRCHAEEPWINTEFNLCNRVIL
jgi:hypothetical protein